MTSFLTLDMLSSRTTHAGLWLHFLPWICCPQGLPRTMTSFLTLDMLSSKTMTSFLTLDMLSSRTTHAWLWLLFLPWISCPPRLWLLFLPWICCPPGLPMQDYDFFFYFGYVVLQDYPCMTVTSFLTLNMLSSRTTQDYDFFSNLRHVVLQDYLFRTMTSFLTLDMLSSRTTHEGLWLFLPWICCLPGLLMKDYDFSYLGYVVLQDYPCRTMTFLT